MPGRVFHHIAFRVQHGPPDEERTLSEHRSHPGVSCTNKRHCIHREHDHLERCRQRRPTSWTREFHHCHRRGRPQGSRNPESNQAAPERSEVFNTMAGTFRGVGQAHQSEAVDEEASSRMLDSQFSDRVVEVVADVQFVQCL